jgi:ABC-2 type transport system permease protein
MNWRRVRAISRKEFLHIFRDARSLALALLLPLLMLLLFGYALSLDVDRIQTVVYDRDLTPQSRDLIRSFGGSRYFEIIGVVSGYREIERKIDRSEALLAIVVPEGFAHDLTSGRTANVQFILDGSDSNTASIAFGYTDTVIQNYSRRVRSEVQIRRGAGELKPAIDVRTRVWYNNDLKSRNYIVPGLIAVILMIIAALLTSLTIAREWETGTMEQLLSTPVRPAELVLGKLSAYFAIGAVDALIALVVGVWIFGVPLRGNVWLLMAMSCIFMFGALCWGIFLSAATRSQLMAYQLGTLTSFLPAFLLSGFIFALENMPLPIQIVSYLIPARYFITIARGIFLKDIGVKVLWLPMLLLVGFAVFVFVAASRRMRQKVA